jgi:integrase
VVEAARIRATRPVRKRKHRGLIASNRAKPTPGLRQEHKPIARLPCSPSFSDGLRSTGCGQMAQTPVGMSRNTARDGVSAAAIRLLVLTGARRNEILTLRWEYVSEEHGCLMLPDSKTGRKVVHLNPRSGCVASHPRLEGDPYVICGERPGAASSEHRKAMASNSSRSKAR